MEHSSLWTDRNRQLTMSVYSSNTSRVALTQSMCTVKDEAMNEFIRLLVKPFGIFNEGGVMRSVEIECEVVFFTPNADELKPQTIQTPMSLPHSARQYILRLAFAVYKDEGKSKIKFDGEIIDPVSERVVYDGISGVCAFWDFLN